MGTAISLCKNLSKNYLHLHYRQVVKLNNYIVGMSCSRTSFGTMIDMNLIEKMKCEFSFSTLRKLL